LSAPPSLTPARFFVGDDDDDDDKHPLGGNAAALSPSSTTTPLPPLLQNNARRRTAPPITDIYKERVKRGERDHARLANPPIQSARNELSSQQS
ncbi:MAG: hypothetical protein JNJ78_21655, partial [Anaerolineae bacterium]|nr:hypothetical protein [Anaerolineae bacterium]